MFREKLIIVVPLALGLLGLYVTNACNEAVCASIVSKCMLTQSCKCDSMNNATCSRDCFYCLDYLYTECCSCVEVCPKPNGTDSGLSAKSDVEEFPEHSPDLFNILTEEKDRLLRWSSYSFPVQLSVIVSPGTEPKEITFGAGTKVTTKGDGVDQEEDIQANCTVAYMSQCMSSNKCKSSCRSMGAAKYRWFHDGCCECVGANCVHYGINESRCLQCPQVDDGDEMTVEESLPPAPHDDGLDDYVVGPAHHEDEDQRQENVVKKEDPIEKEKHRKDLDGDITNSVPKKPAI